MKKCFLSCVLVLSVVSVSANKENNDVQQQDNSLSEDCKLDNFSEMVKMSTVQFLAWLAYQYFCSHNS